MTDAKPTTSAEPQFVIDLRGEVSGMVAAGEYVYQQQVNVADGGLVYVLEEGTVPFAKVRRPVRSIPRADPPLLDREVELAEAIGAIRPGGTVQVTSSPGRGKSLFLTHLAHRDLPADDGVVHLRAKGAPLDDLLFRLFYAFHDSRLPTAFVPPPPQVKRELAGIEAAIVIDDVDHLGNDVDELLDTAADAAFVVSCRESLVDGGAEVALGGLPIDEAADLFARAHGEPLPDRARVRQLCSVLEGHPHCVVFAARVVRAEAIDPLTLAGELSGPDHCRRVATRLLESLPERESRVAAFLAALDGAPVPVAQVTATTHVAGTPEVLRDLSRSAIAQANSPRYAFNSLLLDAADELWDLEEWRASAADQLSGWLEQQPSSDAVVDAAPMALQLMAWAADAGHHQTTVAIGQRVDSALVALGLWGSWEQALAATLASARAMSDGAAAEGWALHQLGTRAMCRGEKATAETLLNEALEIRQEVGVQSAIDATQHNLDVLHLPPGGIPPPETPPPPEPEPPPPPPAPTGGMPAIAKGIIALAVVGVVAGGAWLAFGQGDDDGPIPAGLGARPDLVELSADPGSTDEGTVIVANEGDAEVQIEEIEVGGDAFFHDGGDCVAGAVLPAGEECTIFVSFEPPAPGDHRGVLLVHNSGEPLVLEIELVGTSFAPDVDETPPEEDPSAAGEGELTATPSSVQLGEFAWGEAIGQPVAIENIGSGSAEITFIDLDAPFSAYHDCDGAVLDPGDGCDIEVWFDRFDEASYVAFAEEHDYVPAVLSHPSELVVGVAEGDPLQIPVEATTIAPYPDLVSQIEVVEPVSRTAEGWPVFGLAVTVFNDGGVPSDPADIGVEYYIPETDQSGLARLVSEKTLSDPEAIEYGYNSLYTAPLDPFGGHVTVGGVIIIKEDDVPTGTPIELWAYPDSCEDFDPVSEDPCQPVLELHEALGLWSNNSSEPYDSEVPAPLIIVEILDPLDIIDLLPFLTSTTLPTVQ